MRRENHSINGDYQCRYELFRIFHSPDRVERSERFVRAGFSSWHLLYHIWLTFFTSSPLHPLKLAVDRPGFVVSESDHRESKNL